MSLSKPEFLILLIDDDPSESETVNRILNVLTDVDFRVDYFEKCSQAIPLLDEHKYDLVLLDNRLSNRMSARFSVPIIKASIGRSPMAVISNDVSPDYLQDPKILGVDHIVDKTDLIAFLKSQLDGLLGKAERPSEPA